MTEQIAMGSSGLSDKSNGLYVGSEQGRRWRRTTELVSLADVCRAREADLSVWHACSCDSTDRGSFSAAFAAPRRHVEATNGSSSGSGSSSSHGFEAGAQRKLSQSKNKIYKRVYPILR